MDPIRVNLLVFWYIFLKSWIHKTKNYHTPNSSFVHESNSYCAFLGKLTTNEEILFLVSFTHVPIFILWIKCGKTIPHYAWNENSKNPIYGNWVHFKICSCHIVSKLRVWTWIFHFLCPDFLKCIWDDIRAIDIFHRYFHHCHHCSFYFIILFMKIKKKKSLKGALIITNSLRGNNCTIFRAGITNYLVWERRRFHFDSRIFTSIFSFQPNFFVGSASKFTRFMHFSFRFCLYVFVGYYISIMVRIIELLVHICEGKFMKRV